jgi:hypothetical protein
MTAFDPIFKESFHPREQEEDGGRGGLQDGRRVGWKKVGERE